ncbi:phage holin family protein [Methylorubrum sp. POS3]
MAAAARDASAQLADLLALARIEMRGNVRAVAMLALLFGGAVLLILVSLVLLLLSVRDAVAVLVGSDAIAALIVALPFLIATAILMWAGLRRMSLREVPRGKTPDHS